MRNVESESIEAKEKSIKIMSGLEKHLSSGRLKTDAFPKDDLMEMLKEVYMDRIDKKKLLLKNYLAIYNYRMETAIEEKDGIGLAETLKELILDMQKLPAEMPDDRMTKLTEDYYVDKYNRYVRSVYDRYRSGSMPGKRSFHGKGVIYTVITGQYDALKDPLYVDPAFDYVCFTDDGSLRSEVWDIRYMEEPEEQKSDKVRLARKYKILCHEFLKAYDYSVYVDGKIHIIGDMNRYIDRYSIGSAMLCFPHFVRACAYEEAKACTYFKKDSAEIIEKQMDGYKQEGYPVRNGLIDSACLVRAHHDEALRQVMECWWKEVREKSRRDQLSIGYACWKNDFRYDICDLFIYDNAFICKERIGEAPY